MNRNELTALHDMALFVEVGRTLSFRQASQNLCIPAATLSRRISTLEESLGLNLFHRSTRHVTLSIEGERYFKRCEHLVDEARFVVKAISAKVQLPVGHLRLSMPVDLAVNVIAPLIPEFSKQYPDITFDFDLSPGNKNMVADGIDIAIRLSTTELVQDNAQCIGSVSMGLYASPSYLAIKGKPDKPADLADHICLLTESNNSCAQWKLQNKTKSLTKEVLVSGVCSANNLGMIRVLSEQGMGICQLANLLALESVQSGSLERLLPNWQPLPFRINAITSSSLRLASVDAMLEYLRSKMAGV